MKSAMRQVVVGDIHGELAGFKDILSYAGLIDKKGVWKGQDAVLIQTGDVIDRGPHSVEAVQFLRGLQAQAQVAGGKVARLCGNHELMLLQGEYYFSNFPDPAGLASGLRQEILAGTVQASYTDGVRLYTHAGLRSQIRMAVEGDARAMSRRGGLKTLSNRTNRIFVEALKKGDLESHPIFHVDSVRGGDHDVGGIFWSDYSRISASENAYDIPQVFGHTPTRKNGVQHAHDLKMIDIDAGMYIGYGGHRVYLEIDQAGTITEVSRPNGAWNRKVLSQGTIKRRGKL